MFHILVQVICKTFRASETDRGNKIPQPAKGVWKNVGGKQILWMCKAKQLDQHMHMQSLRENNFVL